jgi:hypothetical protein
VELVTKGIVDVVVEVVLLQAVVTNRRAMNATSRINEVIFTIRFILIFPPSGLCFTIRPENISKNKIKNA